jgi:hypothetical protein
VRKRWSIQPPSTQQQRRIQKKQQYGKQEAEETPKKRAETLNWIRSSGNGEEGRQYRFVRVGDAKSGAVKL